MLALKNWDTNLRSREKQTLWSFLCLYAFFAMLLLGFVGYLYYSLERDLMLQHHKEALSNLTNEHIARLKMAHINLDKNQTYPRDERFNSAIYDSSLKQIFSTLRASHVNLYEDIYLEKHRIYFIKELESYYLGARYVVLEVDEPSSWDKKVVRKLVLYGAFIFIFLVIVGYFFLNLLLRPMRDAIALLDRFIKDTTHELNTPINTILSNIEMIELATLEPPLAKKIQRINIASKTISNLYDDLTYLTLSHHEQSTIEAVDLKHLIEERLDYFEVIFESKKITCDVDMLSDVMLMIDQTKMAKLIDNILSNAIKYNKIGGSIHISLQPNRLEIADTGRGMDASKCKQAFERYVRFDRTVGGFGIGLSIVAAIAKEFNLEVRIDSKLNEGTKVSVSW